MPSDSQEKGRRFRNRERWSTAKENRTNARRINDKMMSARSANLEKNRRLKCRFVELTANVALNDMMSIYLYEGISAHMDIERYMY